MKAKIYSQRVSNDMVNNVLDKIDTKIQTLEFVKANMNSYCSNRMISLVNELGDQLLSSPNQLQIIVMQQQPQKLDVDAFMSVTQMQTIQQADVMVQKAQTISQHKSTSRSLVNHKKKSVKKQQQKIEEKQHKVQQKGVNMRKLQIQQRQNDIEIQNIRQEKERAVQYEKQQQMRKTLTGNKKIRSSKQAINFDYNGNVIQIKADKKNNLISKMVIPKLPKEEDSSTKQIKAEIIDKRKGTYVKTEVVKQEDGKNKKTTKKNKEIDKNIEQEKPEISFSKIKSPIENIEVKEGVKATFNQNVFQKEKKKLNDQQLRKSKSNRKLSRNQYERIKTTTLRSRKEEVDDGNMQYFQPVVLNKQQIRQEKPFSINLKKRAITQIDNEKVRVQDDYLKRQLVDRTKFYEQAKQPRRVLDERPASEVKKKEQLSRIDKYNLDYSRNKTQYSAMKKLSDHDTILPKIHLGLQSNTNYPKTRQKLKQASSIRRELMKKFQESLRV